MDGTTANRLQVKAGLAWANQQAGGKYLRDKSLANLESEARKAGLGLWSEEKVFRPGFGARVAGRKASAEPNQASVAPGMVRAGSSVAGLHARVAVVGTARVACSPGIELARGMRDPRASNRPSTAPIQPGAEARQYALHGIRPALAQMPGSCALLPTDETPYTYNIDEPLYGYHYLKRPYELAARAALRVVQPQFIDARGEPLPADAPASSIAESIYDIPIRPNIFLAASCLRAR